MPYRWGRLAPHLGSDVHIAHTRLFPIGCTLPKQLGGIAETAVIGRVTNWAIFHKGPWAWKIRSKAPYVCFAMNAFELHEFCLRLMTLVETEIG